MTRSAASVRVMAWTRVPRTSMDPGLGEGSVRIPLTEASAGADPVWTTSARRCAEVVTPGSLTERPPWAAVASPG